VRAAALIAFAALASVSCRREDRDQDVQVTTIVCTERFVEVDADRPMLLVDDGGDKPPCSVSKGHTSVPKEPREKGPYRLLDGEATVGRCESP